MTDAADTAHQDLELTCVLVPRRDTTALLPNVAVAEVLSARPLQPVAGGPAWLLGNLDWRGYRVPVLALEALAGGDEGRAAPSEPCERPTSSISLIGVTP